MPQSTQTGPCTPSLFGCLTWARTHGRLMSESEGPLTRGLDLWVVPPLASYPIIPCATPGIRIVSLSGAPIASRSSLCLCPTSEMGRNRSQITSNPRSRTFYFSPAWYLQPAVPTTEGTLGPLCKETVTTCHSSD